MWACFFIYLLFSLAPSASFQHVPAMWTQAAAPNVHLGGLETSQGRGCDAALGKHGFLLWLSVWAGNKEADQTWAQKATAPLSWNTVVALFKAPSMGEKCGKITCHVYFGKTLLRHGWQTLQGRELPQTVHGAAQITLSVTGVFFICWVFFLLLLLGAAAITDTV